MTAEPTTRVVATGADAIGQAARALGAGGLVAFPTETVYGLGADATNAVAIARLYAAKGRPAFNPPRSIRQPKNWRPRSGRGR